MVYVGIDPSFTKTGVCILDTELKQIKFVSISPPETNATYKLTLDRSAYISLNIIKHLDIKKQHAIILEEPLITSLKASSMGILSGVLAWSLIHMSNIDNMYSITPQYVSWLNSPIKKRNGISKKNASRLVGRAVLNFFIEELEYSVEIYNSKLIKTGKMKKRVISHDEYEALLLLTALLRHEGFMSKEDMNHLYKINTNFRKIPKAYMFKGDFKKKEGTDARTF